MSCQALCSPHAQPRRLLTCPFGAYLHSPGSATLVTWLQGRLAAVGTITGVWYLLALGVLLALVSDEDGALEGLVFTQGLLSHCLGCGDPIAVSELSACLCSCFQGRKRESWLVSCHGKLYQFQGKRDVQAGASPHPPLLQGDATPSRGQKLSAAANYLPPLPTGLSL